MADEAITNLLIQFTRGDKGVLCHLLPLIYQELRVMAKNLMNKERSSHTLSRTALVHEAYLKLIHQDGVQWQNRHHFFALASEQMRRILVDHARKRNALKRGEGEGCLELKEEIFVSVSDKEWNEFIHVDEALQKLSVLDERQAKIVELKFFGGLSIEEMSKILDLSPATIKREWKLARAWLYREIKSN